MSRYRNRWRTNLVNEIRRYPALKAIQTDAPDVAMTPSYSGMPGGGGGSRPTEQAAAKPRLTKQEEEIVSAVDRAIEAVLLWPNGQEIVRLVTMVDFQRHYTVPGAALKLNVSERTAVSMRSRFIDVYGRKRGFS